MQSDYLMPVAGGVAVLVLLSVLVLMRRRRSAADGDAGTEAEAAGSGTAAPGGGDSEPPATADALVGAAHHAAPAGSGAPERDDQVEVRTLRAQVHTLEQTLERLSSTGGDGAEAPIVSTSTSIDPAGRRVARAAEPVSADPERYRRQVSATLRGLAGRTAADEAPARTMARVVAAVERLEATDAVARPVLPAVAAGTVLTAATQPRPAALTAPDAAVSAPEPDPRPVDEQAPQPAPGVVPLEASERSYGSAPVAPAAPVDPVDPVEADQPEVPVAPVAAIAPVGPVPVGAARRSSRWSRRDAHHTQGRSRS